MPGKWKNVSKFFPGKILLLRLRIRRLNFGFSARILAERKEGKDEIMNVEILYVDFCAKKNVGTYQGQDQNQGPVI